MGVKADYLSASVDTLMHIDPSLDRDQITDIVRGEMKRHLKDPSIIMDNNVTGVNFRLTLSELCNWLVKDRPVVSGNATFYQQPEVIRSPASTMIRSIKKKRKSIKSKMWTMDERSDEYRLADLSQSNVKVIINAEYGGSGAPTAAFYTKYSPAATTLMAQSVITTMAAFFAGFIGASNSFYHLNDCIDWMNCVRHDRTNDIEKWVQIPMVEEVFRWIRGKFVQFNPEHNDLLHQYIANCSDAELVNIFYTNNVNEFIRRHRCLKLQLKSILGGLPNLEAGTEIPAQYTERFSKVKDYNKYVAKEMFMNPYEQPEVIRKELTAFSETIIKYCFVEYLTPDSIVRLNDRPRNTVLLVDTDSNIIYVDQFIRFVMDEVLEGETFGRTSLYNDMICGNIMASVLSVGVAATLDHYAKAHYVMSDEDRSEFVMKNEFYFRVLFLMPQAKKRYSASTVLREGNILIPFKSEIKGLDFVKAVVSDEVTERFTKMIEDNILFPEELNLHGLMRDFRGFEKEVKDDLKLGHMTYLKNQNFKSISAYKDPWSLQTFKAVAVWNAIYPENKIYNMTKIKLAKLIVTKPEDLEVIRADFPDEYERCISNIFNAKAEIDIGMNDRQREFAKQWAIQLIKSGMKAIAIPGDVPLIPEWIRPLLDYPILVDNVCGSFRSVMSSFKIDEIPIKTPNGKAKLTTGLISI